MQQTGGLGSEVLAYVAGQPDWQPLKQFLAGHPLAPQKQAASRWAPPQREDVSRLGGMAGAFVGAVASAALVAGLAAVSGALFTILWWAIAWCSGGLARAWGKTADQFNGCCAFAATILGILISGTGLAAVSRPVFVFGGLGVLISLPGSLWFAFKTGSTPSGP
jgi:hypothetical protein